MTATLACVGASLLANRRWASVDGRVREQARSYEDATRLTRPEGTP